MKDLAEKRHGSAYALKKKKKGKYQTQVDTSLEIFFRPNGK